MKKKKPFENKDTIKDWAMRNSLPLLRIVIGVVVGVSICYTMIIFRLEAVEKKISEFDNLKIEVKLVEIQTDLKYIKERIDRK